ncbi:MAG: hypothetical protein M1817_002612 [Caeruleum heppii]|nr:MAG: hypothetical protein M1817_002612 [Caeruleum heppii]
MAHNDMTLASRIKGFLLGLAVVDALGGPLEFKKRGTSPCLDHFVRIENFDLEPGTWTADTSMTLCLAQSLIDTDGVFNAQDQIRKYIRWYREGYLSAPGECFDIGGTTRTALDGWHRFFATHPNIDHSDPEGHREGQELIDCFLSTKVRPSHPESEAVRRT